MLLQSLREPCEASEGSRSIWKYFKLLVRAIGESERFACSIQTDLHFADE